MGAAFESSLGFALGIAASPIPIVAVIVMLFSSRPRLNSVVFTSTWVMGIGTVVVVAAFIPDLGTGGESPSDARSWFRVVVGAIFLLLGVINWRRRPAPGEEPTTPSWMQIEGRVGLKSAVALGIVLSFLNPKDVALSVAGGAAIGSEDLAAGETLLAALLFTLVATSTVVLPVAGYLVIGARVESGLEAAKTWLLRHNAVVLSVIWLVLGTTFVYEGVSALIK